ncbi:MAG: cellulose synthase subunit BcsC-related outer membrane protein [Candidatus Dactylopiibacterium sp.]|nr:cellulose synthase subunit BcsC-related outer membrane protein [Candidatus Dactylopiibacterium sp.]
MSKLRTLPLFLILGASVSTASAAWTDRATQLVDDWLQGKAGKSRAIVPPPSPDAWAPQPASQADERQFDERSGPRTPARRAVPAAAASQPVTAPARATPAAAPRSRAEPRYSACVNLPRVWDGLAQMAKQGQEQKAYAGYLNLFNTCAAEAELEGTASQAGNALSPASVRLLLEEPVMYARALRGARYQLASTLFYLDNREGRSTSALERGRTLQAEAVERKDSNLLQVLAWLEFNAGKPAVAERGFRQVLRMNRDDEGARLGLATLLMARERPEAAWSALEPVESEAGDRLKAEVLAQQAREALQARQFGQAERHVRDAFTYDTDNEDAQLVDGWLLLRRGEVDQAAKRFNRVYASDAGKEGAVLGLVAVAEARNDRPALERWSRESGVEGDSARSALSGMYERQGKHHEAARTRQERPEGGTGAFFGAAFRSKSGTVGEDRLHYVSAPIAGVRVEGEAGSLQASISRISASNNVWNANGARAEFAASRYLRDSVLNFGLNYTHVGQTQVGGSVEYKTWWGADFLSLGVERKLVADSLRSIGGDAASGIGPISKNGFRLATSNDVSRGLFLETETKLGAFGGSGVSSNVFFEHESTLFYDWSPLRSYLVAGPMLRVAGTERDENRFTAGYGGYFSPQSEFGAGIKMRGASPAGNGWLLKGDGKVYYTNRSYHNGSVNTFAVEGALSGGVVINPFLIGWGRVAVKSATNYSDAALHLGIMVPFERRVRMTESDIPRVNELE